MGTNPGHLLLQVTYITFHAIISQSWLQYKNVAIRDDGSINPLGFLCVFSNKINIVGQSIFSTLPSTQILKAISISLMFDNCRWMNHATV
jgi:hypothetical protein